MWTIEKFHNLTYIKDEDGHSVAFVFPAFTAEAEQIVKAHNARLVVQS